MASSVHHVFIGEEDLGIFDENKFTVSDAIIVKNATGGVNGLTVKAFFSGLEQMDPHALQALIWFQRFKLGQQVHISTIDFNVAELRLDDEPDPTQAATGIDETSTSEPSPNSAI